jgi:hypothetical protein
VSGINVSAFYCHHHQAWTAHVITHHQTDQENLITRHEGQMSFGPFDSENEVRAWMLRALLAMDDLLP